MKIIDATDQKKWDEFVTSHDESNFLHSWAWGEFHESRGKTVVRRIAQDDKGKIIAAYVGQVEVAKRGTYMAIAGGPIMDYTNKKLVKTIFADIKEQGEKNKCVFVRIRPQIVESEENRAIFAKNGLKPAPMYLSAELVGVVDLRKSPDELFANYSRSLRRNFRLAHKDTEITTEVSTDPESIKEFYKTQMETADRHKFVAFSEDFLEKQFAAFAKYDAVRLYTARYNGEVLAHIFFIFYGNEASYHYAASTALGNKHKGVLLLHEMAMEEARKRGIERYNMWGITKLGDTKHRFYGVSEFKRSFGTYDLNYLHAHDLIIKPLAYKVDYVIERVRSKIRHV